VGITLTLRADDLELERCPAAVQETIRANARDGKIDEVDSVTIQERMLYVAKVELPGNKFLKVWFLLLERLVSPSPDEEGKPSSVYEAIERLRTLLTCKPAINRSCSRPVRRSHNVLRMRDLNGERRLRRTIGLPHRNLHGMSSSQSSGQPLENRPVIGP
jgi:hypothetical protein